VPSFRRASPVRELWGMRAGKQFGHEGTHRSTERTEWPKGQSDCAHRLIPRKPQLVNEHTTIKSTSHLSCNCNLTLSGQMLMTITTESSGKVLEG
jgi:hypothetical protein